MVLDFEYQGSRIRSIREPQWMVKTMTTTQPVPGGSTYLWDVEEGFLLRFSSERRITGQHDVRENSDTPEIYRLTITLCLSSFQTKCGLTVLIFKILIRLRHHTFCFSFQHSLRVANIYDPYVVCSPFGIYTTRSLSFNAIYFTKLTLFKIWKYGSGKFTISLSRRGKDEKTNPTVYFLYSSNKYLLHLGLQFNRYD